MVEGNTEMAFEHCTKGEAKVAKKLVRVILEMGYKIRHNDGEEWSDILFLSGNEGELFELMAATDEEFLQVISTEGKKVGTLQLIWGNEEDGSELIADYTDNDEVRAIVKKVEGDGSR